MDIWTPVLTGSMLAVFTVVLGLLNKVQFDSLKTLLEVQITSVKEDLVDLKKDLSEFKEDNHRRFDQVHREVVAVRSDMTQLALAFGQARPQAG
jgi:hypothetical protein